jgi:hypothetical protein
MDRVDWKELEPEFIGAWGWPNGKWEPEHLAILGPTGSGKSKFMGHILTLRCDRGGASAIIICTKPGDKTTAGLVRKGWKLRRNWPPQYAENKVIYWPPSGKPGSAEGIIAQRKAIQKALVDLWKEDSNTIVSFDEIAYIEDDLRLRPTITKYWREARALGITIVASTQRPRNVSRYMHSEPTWSVAFRPDDEDDAKRVAEIIGSRRTYTPELMQLNPYEFILINRRKRTAYISKLPK